MASEPGGDTAWHPTLSQLRQTIHRSFRTLKKADGRPKDPGALLSRHLALWLSTSPFADKQPDTPYAALMSSVGSYLAAGSSPASEMWNDKCYSWPPLRAFLAAPERGGCFRVVARAAHTGNDLVQLDVEAIRAMAAGGTAAVTGSVGSGAGGSRGMGAGSQGASSGRQPGSAAGPRPLDSEAEAEAQLEAELGSLFLSAAVALSTAAATDTEALRCVARMLVAAPPPHKLLFAQLGSEVPKQLGRPCARLRQQCGKRPDVFGIELEGKSTYTVQLVHPRLLSLAASLGARAAQPSPAGNDASASDHGVTRDGGAAAWEATAGAAAAAAGTAVRADQAGAVTAELIGAAFTLDQQPAASTAARQLRQAIANYLASNPDTRRVLGPRRAMMSMLGHHLRLQHAALWMNPAHKFGRLRTFLESPDSRGVFLVHSKPGDSEPIVELDEAALRRAAAVAIAVAEGRGQHSSSGVAAALPADPAAPAVADTASGSPAPPPQHQQQQLAAASVEAERVQSLPVALRPAGAHAAAAAAASSASSIAALASEPAQLQHLPDAGVCVVADPYGEQLIAMLQHCGCCSRIGLAVQAHGGSPTLVSLYAPPALMQLEGPEENLVQWPAAVYLVDPLAAAAAYGGGADGDAAAAALLCSLQPLLEAPSVAKVVHGGGGALASLEAAISDFSGGVPDGAAVTVCSYPVHDTRVILASVESMLRLPHAPPAPSPQPSNAVGSYVPGAGYASGGVALLRGLHTHVARLRDALAGTGLWADRPQLLAALTARHFAALREDGAASDVSADGEGGAASVLTRPLGPSQVELAARASRHLPELWAALVQEAVPWVALHASTAAMAGHRQQLQQHHQ